MIYLGIIIGFVIGISLAVSVSGVGALYIKHHPEMLMKFMARKFVQAVKAPPVPKS
jgi:hypothetical protein